MRYYEDIIDGAKTAFIDKNTESKWLYKPIFVSNNFNTKTKVINSIRDELEKCDEFFISTAFITNGGLTPLLQVFYDLNKRGIKGKILTTDYLNFTEPDAIKKLDSMSNIEIKIYPQEKNGFHTKAYIFRKKNLYKAIVGSSNLTLNALTVNKEWNIMFTSFNDGEILSNIFSEFWELWKLSKDVDEILPSYEIIYNNIKRFEKIKEITEDEIEKNNSINLIPNSMQENFLEKVRNLTHNGKKRALLISATGTGKTYASAFAVKDFNPKKFLFLVHREQIAKQSISSYKKVFKDSKVFGLLSGNSKDKNANYLFSTIQTMSKDNIYSSYKSKEFDFIVIDEVHKAGASSYQKIMSHFKPKFWLGMTASPDRMDDFNIYELFDNNIAHEIRLKEALEEDLLCPFHYFGISDFEIDGIVNEDNLSDFQYLASNKRVDYLIQKSEFYGHSGDRIKALVFCSRKEEAKILSKKFNEWGYSTAYLTGENSQKEREEAIYRLTNDENTNKLDYIFTVDVFNEGVDIPEINQVLLVRPTKSPIIFIQQLGRGLRKFKNKEYVVILDFIGNYNNNFMIPIALSGDRSYDKDNMRHYLMEGNKIIPGASSINFDKISKERIFKSINDASFSKKRFFKEKYLNLKFKLGKIPKLIDFYENGDLDPILILNHSTISNYYEFLQYADEDYEEQLSDDESDSLKFLSKWLANGKRPHELFILKFLVNRNSFSIHDVHNSLIKNYNISNDINSINSAINFLKLNYIKDNEKKKYENISSFLKESKKDEFKISEEFKRFLDNKAYSNHVNDLIRYALLKYKKEYFNNGTEETNLKLYAKYSRKDVCRILNWETDDSSTVYGYRIKYDTCPIFVKYKKPEDISSSTNYEDEFESDEIFSWMTRNRLTIKSKEVIEIKNHENNNLKIYFFIKKSDNEGSDFYYMGQVKPVEHHETTISDDDNNELPIVNFKLKFHTPVKEDLHDYLVN
ncbi:MAG: DEAD/DEAH box helicase [Methanobrevibacter sp.]|jgi:superfamily II DNA or RNA helicase/HKD family nuclease|nr:DEAD/DEAH box helicase [Methanobrevibacter sp.]